LNNRPNYPVYPIISDKIEKCAFCKGDSTEVDRRTKCGPLYGPIKVKKHSSIFLHELCAIWTPEIYLDDNNKLKGLFQAIDRCSETKCSFCGLRGAGLGCFIEKCPHTYHYLCAKIVESLFVNSKFRIYCPDHKETAPQEDKDEENEMQDEDGPDANHYICCICEEDLDDNIILVCDQCQKGYHYNCHQPQVSDQKL